MRLLNLVLFVISFHVAHFTEPWCEIELSCAACVPEAMPRVSGAAAAGGALRAAPGAELGLACGGGAFLAYPARAALRVRCEAGRYRVLHDQQLRHLLDLGCQESVFEDVLHQVENCGSPLQGRAYQVRESNSRALHLATVCFDEDRAIAVWLHMSNAEHNQLELAPHDEHSAPLSLLGNFNHMFDAKTRRDSERLFSDDAHMNKRLHEMFKHDHYSFAGQSLTSAKLLSSHYFDEQNMQVTDFASNKVIAWKSVVEGNLRHVQRDVSALLARAARGSLRVWAGARGQAALRAGGARVPLALRGAGRAPAPRYVWTVLHAPQRRRALALVVLNDPFVAVSEIRDAVFCESACGSVSWLRELRRDRHYESPVYGLTFCCSLANFTDVVTELPRDAIDVPAGREGMLTDL
ncbi:uncharacterized protein LOC113498309 [Trichoplusia ni]|uniref:Uncharacterized protein LOC113498309 n=1 Tax=Trichoplusia ni TaxID=7111 RepID=A0A7E5W0M7_TRINI|nr:uncharacterized protein LOC113498309 [Trichoplusia ni]